MAEIKIKFDLTFSRRFLAAVGAAVMMLCAVADLESDSVVLSTYYPAPSGVYTQLITTSNTYLARDGGAASMVGIGTAGPNVKLDVRGAASSRVQFNASDGGLFSTAMIRAGATTNAVYASARGIDFRTGAAWTDADSGGVTAMTISMGGNVGVGVVNTQYGLDVNGDIVGRTWLPTLP